MSSIEIDSARSARFLREQSASFPFLLNLIQASNDENPDAAWCNLIFANDAGVISRISSFQLRDIDLQGEPGDNLRALDRIQCATCILMKNLQLRPDALANFLNRRIEFVEGLLREEFRQELGR